MLTLIGIIFCDTFLLLFLALFCFVFLPFFFSFETWFLCVALTTHSLVSLCRPYWPHTHRNLLFLPPWVLKLQARATTQWNNYNVLQLQQIGFLYKISICMCPKMLLFFSSVIAYAIGFHLCKVDLDIYQITEMYKNNL